MADCTTESYPGSTRRDGGGISRRVSARVVRRTLSAVLCAVLCIVAGGASRADELPRYTLDDCLRLGRQRSAAMANARRDELIARAQERQVGAEAYPQFSVLASYTRLDELQEVALGTNTPVELGTLDNYSFTAELRQLLYSGGRVRAALDAARYSRTYASLGVRAAEAVLLRDVALQYHDLLLATAAVEVNEQAVAQLRDLAEETDAKYRRGALSEFDALSARVKLANRQPVLIQARNRRALSQARLRSMLDLGDGPFGLAGELVYAPRAANAAQAAGEAVLVRPEAARLRAMVRLLSQGVLTARADRRPSLYATAAYNGANSYGYVSFEDQWQWHWNAGLSLTWNLFDGGLRQGLIRQRELAVAKAEADLVEIEKAIRLEVTQACLDLAYADELVRSGEGTVRVAERAQDVARARYDSGLGTQLEYTDANLALSVARLTRLEALRAHMDAVVRLDYASGRLMATTARRPVDDGR